MGLFSGKLDVGKLVDKASSGIDKIFFTKEEKADFSFKIADSLAQYVNSTISENSARSITRRYLAILIMATYLFLMVAACGVSIWDVEKGTFIFDVANKMSTLVLMVGAFFFGAYMVGSHLLDKKKKKDK